MTEDANQHEMTDDDAPTSDTHRDAESSTDDASHVAPLPDTGVELDDEPAAPPLSPQPEDEPIGLFEWLWLAGCTLLGALFRAVNLGGHALWDDEVTTLITVRRPIGDGLISPQDPQPPLYQLLLRALTGGDPNPSEALLRAPACAFGIATIAAAWWCARHFVGRVGAGIAALLIALNPLLIHHARDARPYALFIFFAALSITFFYRLVKRGGWANAVGYAVCTAGMFFSHYYAMFFVAAQGAYAAVDFIMAGPARRRWKWIAGGIAAGVVLSLPVLLLFLNLLTGGMAGSWWISPPHGIIHGFDALGDMLGVRALGVLCAIPLLGAVWLTSRPTLRREYWVGWWVGKERAIYLAMFVAFGLFLPLIGSLLVRPGWVERYSLPVVVPMLILGLGFLRSIGPVVTALVLALTLAYTAPKALNEMQGQPGLREAVATVQKHAKPNDAVAIPDWPFTEDFQNPGAVGTRYYGYDGELEMISVHELDAVVYNNAKKVSAQRLKQIKDDPDALLPRQRTWAICFHSTGNVLKQYLIKRGRTFSEWTFGQYDHDTPLYTVLRIDPRRE